MFPEIIQIRDIQEGKKKGRSAPDVRVAWTYEGNPEAVSEAFEVLALSEDPEARRSGARMETLGEQSSSRKNVGEARVRESVSTATIARVGAFFHLVRDLHDSDTFAPLRFQFFSQRSSNFCCWNDPK